MNAIIYYFSGTGNSLTVAREIAEGIGASLVPIPSVIGQDTIHPDAEAFGIVFPVYYGELPMIVEGFVGKLKDISGKYIFAVCTFGGAADASLRQLKRKLRDKGGALSAGFGAHMPQNAFLKPREDREKLKIEWQRRRDTIVRGILANKKGLFYPNTLLELVMMAVHAPLIRPACRREFIRLSGLPGDSPYSELKRRSDNGFTSSQACTECGLCSRVCPVNNIMITAGRPEWQHRCEHCLACYNWCPNKAISGGITHGYRYSQSGITSSDIANQKENI